MGGGPLREQDVSAGQGPGRASDFLGAGEDRVQGRRRGKIGRTLRGGSPPTQAEERAKPVRITVDLAPSLHRHLKQSALDADVRGAAVVRVLLELHRDDPDVAAKVTEELRRQG